MPRLPTRGPPLDMKPRAAHIAPTAAAGRATNTAIPSTSSSSVAASCSSMATALEGATTRGSSCGGGGGGGGGVGVEGGVPRHPTATTSTSAGGASTSTGAVSNGTASSGGAPLGGDSPVGSSDRGGGGVWKHAADLDEGKQLQLQQLARAQQQQQHQQPQITDPGNPCGQGCSTDSSAAAPARSYGKAPAAPYPYTAPAAMGGAPAAPLAKLPFLTPGQKLGLTLLMPLLAAWWVAAFLTAWLLTLLVVPSYLVAQVGGGVGCWGGPVRLLVACMWAWGRV